MNSLGLKRVTFFIIRHKATNQVMPQAKRNRGYTHWNPGNTEADEFVGALPTPRLLETKKQAEKCVSQWVSLPNAEMYWRQTAIDNEVQDVRTKPDGRTKNDLEIIKVRLARV